MPENNLHVFSSFADCDEVLRHPASCSDRLKSSAAQRAIAAGEQPRPVRHARLPVPRPARPHAAAQAGQQGVLAEGRQGARARHRHDGRRTARQGRRRRRVRGHRRSGLPAARRGDLPTARCAHRGRAEVQLGLGAARSGAGPVHRLHRPVARIRGPPEGRAVAAGVPARPAGAPARAARRRPDLRTDRGRGVRRPAHRGRDRRDLQPAADRRPRDHGEPDRQRGAGDAAQPPTLDCAGRGRRTRPRHRRRDPALRPAGSTGGTGRRRRHGRSAMSEFPRATP